MSGKHSETGLQGQELREKAGAVLFSGFDNWVSMSLTAAALWALSCVIDVCYVGNGVYRKASDGPAISGLFCLVPALATSGPLDLADAGATVIGVGMLAGVVYLMHSYFYFKALFALNDAVNAEIFNTLGVLLVPLLAFVLLGERLGWLNYAAIGIGVLGILVLTACQLSRLSWRVVGYLTASVVSISLMMVMQAWVLQYTNYATTVWLFSSTAFALVVVIFGVPKRKRVRIGGLCTRFGALFVFVELLELGAVLSSQRATDVGPSVSLVALVECSLPIFVMVFSWLAATGAALWMPLRASALRNALLLQTSAAPSKIASMLLIVFAIFLVQG